MKNAVPRTICCSWMMPPYCSKWKLWKILCSISLTGLDGVDHLEDVGPFCSDKNNTLSSCFHLERQWQVLAVQSSKSVPYVSLPFTIVETFLNLHKRSRKILFTQNKQYCKKDRTIVTWQPCRMSYVTLESSELITLSLLTLLLICSSASELNNQDSDYLVEFRELWSLCRWWATTVSLTQTKSHYNHFMFANSFHLPKLEMYYNIIHILVVQLDQLCNH